MIRPREFDLDDVVRKILFVFWQKGYDATSLRDIEQATGVARTSLYNVFGDKEGLFLAALERYVDATKRLYEKYLATHDIVGLESLIAAHTNPEKLGEAGNWGCLMVNSVTAANSVSPAARRMIEDFRTYAVNEIGSVLTRARDIGEIKQSSVDLDEVADFILTTMWGAKAVIRHAGNVAAAAPVSRTLSHMIRSLQSVG